VLNYILTKTKFVIVLKMIVLTPVSTNDGVDF